jgi:hypothetical protein
MPAGTLNPSNRKEFNRQLIEEFRANGGKVTGQFANRPSALASPHFNRRQERTPLYHAGRWFIRRMAIA